MGRGGVKHQAEIIGDVQSILEEQGGVMTLQHLTEVLTKFYSDGYSEGQGQMIILRELSRKNIAKLVKIKLPNAEDTRENKYTQKNPFLSLLVAANIEGDERQHAIATFLRNFLPKRIPPLKRSVSKEILMEALPKLQKRVDTMEFPPVKFRAMLLHGFLLETFGGRKFTLDEVAKALPVGLSIQLIRGIGERKVYPHLSVVEPLDRSGTFDLDMIVSYLKKPFQCLVSQDNVVYPVARVVFEEFGIDRTFHFLRDPRAYSDYWILMATLANDNTDYPVSIMGLFEGTLSRLLSNVSTYYLPFFPRQIERVARVVGIAPQILSYTVQRVYKVRLREAQCPKEIFMDSKLFPPSGIAMFIVSGKSALPVTLPQLPKSFDTEFEVNDSSYRSLAKLFAVSTLTTQGYIQNRRSNFQLFKNQVEKWLAHWSTFSNVFVSLKEDPGFLSLIRHETAALISELRVPVREPSPDHTSDSSECEELDQAQMLEERLKAMNRSQSARFVETSKGLISAVLTGNDIRAPQATKSVEELREVFAQSFPKRSQSTEEDVEQEQFVTAQMVDSPSVSMSENDEPEFSEDEEAKPPVPSSFSDDEEPEAPGYDMESLVEVTESQFLSTYTIRKNVHRCPLSVSVAMEFIKAVLGTVSDGDGAEYLRVRQLCHLHPGDISKALWYLAGCAVYHNTWNLTIPKSKWKLGSYKKMAPHPTHIQILEEEDSPVSLDWQYKSELNIGLRKQRWDEQEKKREYKFEWIQNRFLFPKPPVQATPLVGYSLEYDGDPLGHFTFGRYEDPLPRHTFFPRRHLINLIHAGGVNGVALTEIFNAFSIGPHDRTACDRVIDLLHDMCASGELVRVPSSSLDTHFSLFLALNTMCSKAQNGIELVNVHIWRKWDGSIATDVLSNLLKNVTTYVLSHEFCDFTDLMTHFPYISPFDLCVLLDSLENDEIIVSDYFEVHEATISEPEMIIPVAPFRNCELFLARLSLQTNPVLHRRIRTTKMSLANLATL